MCVLFIAPAESAGSGKYIERLKRRRSLSTAGEKDEIKLSMSRDSIIDAFKDGIKKGNRNNSRCDIVSR